MSSCWWWASFLWRTSQTFSRWEWGRQLTVSLRDSAAAKRLDSADTHWPRESREKTMITQCMSRELINVSVWGKDRESEPKVNVEHANVSQHRSQDVNPCMLLLFCYCSTLKCEFSSGIDKVYCVQFNSTFGKWSTNNENATIDKDCKSSLSDFLNSYYSLIMLLNIWAAN